MVYDNISTIICKLIYVALLLNIFHKKTLISKLNNMIYFGIFGE